MLFAADLGKHDAETLVRDFWREFPGDPEDRGYADTAVRGVLAERERLDAVIVQSSANWRLERMSAVARNVLRLGSWELSARSDVPRAVIIDESVELAKRYGGGDAAFVNGVLDRIADTLGRRDAAAGPGARSIEPPTLRDPVPLDGAAGEGEDASADAADEPDAAAASSPSAPSDS